MKELSKIIGTIMKKHTGTHASSIAFFFFMSLVPLMIIYACLFPKGGAGAAEMTAFLQGLVPQELGGLIETMITEAFSQSRAAFSVSLLALLWTASRGIKAMIDGLNAMYDETEKRGFAKLTGISFVYTFILVLFLSAAVFLIFSDRLLRFLKTIIPSVVLPGGTRTFVSFLLMLIVGILFFELLYTHLPAGSRSFRYQFPGAFLASSGWFILSIAFRVYVGYFNGIARLYGSIATVALFLFWLYLVFFLLLAGGCVNHHFKEFVPAGIYRFLTENRRKGNLTGILFLAGFTAYVSNGFISWKLGVTNPARIMQTIFRLITQISWISAAMICAESLGKKRFGKPVFILYAMAFADIFLLRPRMFGSILLYLVILTFFYLAELMLCLRVVREEDRKTGLQS